MNVFKHDPRKMLMSFDISALVKKKNEIGDQIKALNGPDTICLFISLESLHYKHFNKTENRYSHIHARMTCKTS